MSKLIASKYFTKYFSMNNMTMEFYQTEAKKYFDLTFYQKLEKLWKIALDFMPYNATVLDLGCGSGRDILFFTLKNIKAFGLDYSYNLSSLAHQHTNQPIVQADFLEIPFSNESYDMVWSIGSLLHLKKDQVSKPLFEIKRILKKNGYLMTSMKKGSGEEITKDGRFFAYYEADEWNEKLSTSGFIIKNIYNSIEKRHYEENNQTLTIPWIFSVAQKY
jgi:ubiquinone/menaquinone biosynthesis C-methylase UbiE